MPFTDYGKMDLVLATVLSLAVAGGAAAFAGDHPWLWALVALALAFWALMLNFFRDPERQVPSGPRLVIAPADGVVQDLQDAEDATLIDGPVSRLGIFLSPLDVHVNRMPMACKVLRVIERPGKMLKAFDPRAIDENESAAVLIEVLGGAGELLVRQVTGAVARRIVCPVQAGDEFAAGQRYGMIKLGSRTEVWAPRELGLVWKVGIGDRVVGGVTVIGEIPADASSGPGPG